MAAKLLLGTPLAERLQATLRQDVDVLRRQYRRLPTLASVAVGDNAGSDFYVRSQARLAKQLGIGHRGVTLPPSATRAEVLRAIDALNADGSVSGIIVQLPLPAGLDAREMIARIAPEKDIEGMYPERVRQVIFGKMRVGSCTALAVMELIQASGVDLAGAEVVIIGHSEIVGKPLSLLLVDQLATTTICHVGTDQRGRLADHVRRAEVLVVAVGRAGLIQGAWVRPGAVVIDVGINRVGGRIVGDVEFETAVQVAGAITPVPGGVGPLTVTLLMRNLLEAFRLQQADAALREEQWR